MLRKAEEVSARLGRIVERTGRAECRHRGSELVRIVLTAAPHFGELRGCELLERGGDRCGERDQGEVLRLVEESLGRRRPAGEV